MFRHITVAKERVFVCLDVESMRAKTEENRRQAKIQPKKNTIEQWLEFKNKLNQYIQVLFLNKLERKISLIVVNIAIWLANILNSLDFFSRYSKVVDVAFWIVGSSFYLVPATPVILFFLGLILILCIATAKLKNRMEKAGINITRRKLLLISTNYYFALFLMVFFTTFIFSQAVHSFDIASWIHVFILVIGYNVFLILYSLFGALAVVGFDHLVTKFCDYTINDVAEPQEVSV